jgi:ribonuclease-3 family protein
VENFFEMNFTLQQVNAISNLGLAHVGDGVYELLARSAVAARGGQKVVDAHRQTVALVAAPAQAKAMEAILPHLTEEERSAFTRGRNAKPHSTPKHCSLREYALATGLECLFGTLYLKGETQRVLELWQMALEVLA